MIYLACPFRHSDELVQRKRCAAAHYVAAKLSLAGKLVFSPLTHNETLIDIIEDQVPGEQWMQFDLKIFSICTELYVIKMPDWEKSKGVDREIAYAKVKGLPVKMIDPPLEKEYAPFIRPSRLSLNV